MWAYRKYVMSIIVKNLYPIKKNDCFYLDVTNDAQLNWWNSEQERYSMNVSASKIWNESTHTQMALYK